MYIEHKLAYNNKFIIDKDDHFPATCIRHEMGKLTQLLTKTYM